MATQAQDQSNDEGSQASRPENPQSPRRTTPRPPGKYLGLESCSESLAQVLLFPPSCVVSATPHTRSEPRFFRMETLASLLKRLQFQGAGAMETCEHIHHGEFSSSQSKQKETSEINFDSVFYELYWCRGSQDHPQSQRLARRTGCAVILMAEFITIKGYRAESAKGKGLGKSPSGNSTSLWSHLSVESHTTCLIP